MASYGISDDELTAAHIQRSTVELRRRRELKRGRIAGDVQQVIEQLVDGKWYRVFGPANQPAVASRMDDIENERDFVPGEWRVVTL